MVADRPPTRVRKGAVLKRTMSAARVAVATFVLVVSGAQAGCTARGYLGAPPYPGELGRVVAGNLAVTCPNSVYLGPPLNRCAERLFIGGRPYWGYFQSSDTFVAVYGPDRQLLWAAPGAAIGLVVSRDVEGVVTGVLTAYGLAAAAAHSRAVERRRESRLYTVRNPTMYVAEIYDGRARIALLRPHDEERIPPPEALLTAHVLVPQGGRLRTVIVELQSRGGTVWEVPPM